MKRPRSMVTPVLLGLPLFLLFPDLTAQKDLRDVVKTKRGKEIRGRVLRLYDEDEILIIQGRRPKAGGTVGGKRIRIPRAKVEKITTINQALREFLDLRAEAKKDEVALWKVVEWAETKELERMGKLLALDLVLRNDANEIAHKYLGHKKVGKRWRWKRKDTYMSRKKYEQKISKWGSALVLESEHFQVRTDAGLRLAVDVVLDLETVYLHWFQLFGKRLNLQEAVSPMQIHLYRDIKRFPSWTLRVKRVHYTPPEAGDVSNTFVSPDTGEPEQLITVVTQQLIYRTVRTGGGGSADARDHISGWLEYGLGQWMESMFEGKYGSLKLRRPTLDPRQTRILAKMDKLKLKRLVHASYSQFLDYSKRVPERWAKASHFVYYLMEEEHGHRDAFLEYILDVFRAGKGDSSSAFGRLLKVPVDKVEGRVMAWLHRQTGGGGKKGGGR